jgi:hypothetical protein
LSRCDLLLVSDLETSIQGGLSDLRPQPSSNAHLSAEFREQDKERLLELGMLPPDEMKTWRTRLEAALVQSQHLWKLDSIACSKYVATLPPVQP